MDQFNAFNIGNKVMEQKTSYIGSQAQNAT